LVEELIKYLSELTQKCILTIPIFRKAINSSQLRYYRRELDFVSMAVLSTLAVNEINSLEIHSKCKDAISLSALLKASHRLSTMTDITGSICVTKGKFFIRIQRKIEQQEKQEKKKEIDMPFMEPSDPAEKIPIKEKPEEIPIIKSEPKFEKIWKQAGINAELVISLNMVLNMYILQIYMQDKSSPLDSLHIGRHETQAKRSFYISNDLHFKYIDSEEIELKNGKSLIKPQSELPISPDMAKNIKNFVFFWQNTIDPDKEVF